MEYSIADVTPKLMATVNTNDSLELVAATLSRHGLSTILVLEPDGNCFGVIGALDLICLQTHGHKPNALRAWEICKHRIVETPADTSVEDAAKMMAASKVHHLVVRDHGKIVGVVSAMDILEKYLLPNGMLH